MSLSVLELLDHATVLPLLSLISPSLASEDAEELRDQVEQALIEQGYFSFTNPQQFHVSRAQGIVKVYPIEQVLDSEEDAPDNYEYSRDIT